MNERRTRTTRRAVLMGAGGLVAGGLVDGLGIAPPAQAQRILGNPAAMRAAIAKVVGEAPVKKGRVKLDIPPLVENGNSVGITVAVDSPMTEADHVKAIHVFTEKNPQPNVVAIRLGPRAGRASVSMRIRLADTGNVVAIAEMSDGSFWSDEVNVVITLGACLEDNLI